MLSLKIVIGLMSLILIIITLELIRREKLKERYALLWLFTCLTIFLFSFTPRLIRFVSEITGMYYLSIISLVAFLFVLLILLHFSTVISKLHDRNKELTQQYALLQYKITQIETRQRAGNTEIND